MTTPLEDILRRAGVSLPPGAKVLGTVLPKAPKPKSGKSLAGMRCAPGILIVEVVVDARPIPWKAPTVLRSGHSFKDKSMLRWQGQVREAAERAMSGFAPYSHAVRLEFTFELRRIKGRTLPDLSNLVKSTEDALQKIVITNDRNVRENSGTRLVGDLDRATIRVYSTEEP